MDTVSTIQSTPLPEYAIAREGDNCSVCFDTFSVSDPRRVMAIECQHHYHEECIRNWFSLNHHNCPVCRRDVNVHNLKVKSIVANTEAENPLVTACRYGSLDFIAEQHAKNASILSCNYWSNSHGEEVPLILIAIECNQLEVVRLILKLCPDAINHRSAKGTNAMITAAKVGQVAIATQLLESGADVNCHNAQGVSPLLTASFRGHSHFIDFLLANHVNMDVPDILGRTPLIAAIWFGHMDIVHKLIDHGCDLNQTTANGLASALTYALNRGYYGIASLLIEKNASVSPLDLSILGRCSDYKDLFITVLKRLKASLCDEDFHRIINGDAENNISPIRECAKHGAADSVCRLVNYGADPEASGTKGHTAMYLAAINGHLPVVEQLLEWGASTNVTLTSGNNNGMPMLLATIRAGHTKVATTLANHPATDIHQAFMDRTPLAECVNTENNVDTELLDVLLKRKACVSTGSTNPLAVAILKHPTDVISILVKHTGKENINNPVLSPLEIQDRLQPESPVYPQWVASYFRQLKQYEPSGMRPLPLAIFANKPEVVKMLVDAGANVTDNDLNLSTRMNNGTVIKYLFQSAHVSADASAQKNFTPAATAIMRGLSDEEVISKLHHSKKGKLMIDDAIVQFDQARSLFGTFLSSTDHEDYLRLFSRNDSKGMRPVTLAILFQRQQIVESLIKAGAILTGNDYRLAGLVNNEAVEQQVFQKLPEKIRRRFTK